MAYHNQDQQQQQCRTPRARKARNTTSRTTNNSNNMDEEERGFHLGLYGWRKKCLYLLVFSLMLLIVVNLGLTLWILKVMEFSADGMGQLKVVPGGLQLSGQAVVMDLLRASTIRSRHAQPIAIESGRNLTVNTRDEHGALANQLFLGHDRLECQASTFRVTDTQGNNLFSVADNEVVVGANALRVDGEGGAVFRQSIQTPLVRADAGQELRLQSPTRSLEVSAAQELLLHSHAGSLEAVSLENLQLNSKGSIRLNSPHIRMANLKTAPSVAPGMSWMNHEHAQKIFQLCACANGKLFLAPSHGVCAGDDQTVCKLLE